MISRIDSFRGALLGTMVGDCMGALVEGLDPAPAAGRYPDLASFLKATPGRYGAATEMTAATAASLAEHPEFDGDDMAARLAEGASTDRGYGTGTGAAIDRLRVGVPWRMAAAGLGGRTNFGNGAATRMAPIGLLFGEDAELLRWTAEEVAAITHQHALAGEGAVLQATAVALAAATADEEISGEEFLLSVGRETSTREYRSRYEIAASLLARDADEKTIVARLGNTGAALGSVVTAAYCFARSPEDFTGCVAFALRLAGSARAIASMAGAISGARLGAAAIPERWLDGLEREPIGPETFEELARALARLPV
jgi:poly(ADP-ribose) glycohydrolase ARH3